MSEITEALAAAHAAGRGRAVACAVARLTLPVWEKEYPGDLRPRRAIETAEREDATAEELRDAARAADAAAADAASWKAAAWEADDAAARAAVWAAEVVWVAVWAADAASRAEATRTAAWAAELALRAGVSPEAILDAIRIVMKVDGDSQVDCVTDWLRQHGTGGCVMIAVKPGDTVVAPAGAPVMMAACVDVKVLSLSPTGMDAIKEATYGLHN